MSNTNPDSLVEPDKREPVLDTVDRISEMCFGLFMALTFVGAVAVAEAGKDPGSTLMHAALGCNLAWGLVDAVMFLVRTVVDRSRRRGLAIAVQSARDIAAARKLLLEAMPSYLHPLMGVRELDAIRARLAPVNLRDLPKLHWNDFFGALGIFLIVVFSTFPVALPFVLLSDIPTALVVSRVLTLVMLFGAGMALGRHAGYGGWRAGFGMMGLGVGLTVAIIALGG
jgi:hypothetical protein